MSKSGCFSVATSPKQPMLKPCFTRAVLLLKYSSRGGMRGAAGHASAVTGCARSGGCRRCLGRQAGWLPAHRLLYCSLWEITHCCMARGDQGCVCTLASVQDVGPATSHVSPVQQCWQEEHMSCSPGQDSAGNEMVRKAKDDLCSWDVGKSTCCVEGNGLRAQPH